MNDSRQYNSIFTAVLLKSDGGIWRPMNHNVSIIIFRFICLVIGIPLNTLLAVVILWLRRLNSKPRNIFLLGITFSNLSAFIPPLIEIINFFHPNDVLCKMYVATNRLHDVYLLLNILVSLTDRFIAIRHSMWHRKNVTVPWVVFVLITGFITTTFICKFIYITGLASLNCDLPLVASQTVLVLNTILFILCVIARVTVYLQTRKLLQDQQREASTDSRPESIPMNTINHTANSENVPNNHNTSSSSSSHQQQYQHIDLGTRINKQVLRRMEEKATQTLVISVTSLFVLCCPLVLFFSGMSFCRLLKGDIYCSKFYWMGAYFKQLGLIHAIYHPILYLTWNEEISNVFKRRYSFS